MLGASLIGAEWPSRSIATLLTWEPRRVRVAVAKILATVVVVFVGSVLLQAIFALALLPAAVFRGTTAGADATWLQGVVGIGSRVAAAASLAPVMGASIALLGRSTAAALGAGFVYALIEVSSAPSKTRRGNDGSSARTGGCSSWDEGRWAGPSWGRGCSCPP